MTKKRAHEWTLCLTLFALEPLVGTYRGMCSYALEYLHYRDKEYHRDEHDQIFISVITIIYRDLSKAASADDAAHRGIA